MDEFRECGEKGEITKCSSQILLNNHVPFFAAPRIVNKWSLHRKLQTAFELRLVLKKYWILRYLGTWSSSLFASLKTIDLLSALTSNSVVIYQVLYSPLLPFTVGWFDGSFLCEWIFRSRFDQTKSEVSFVLPKWTQWLATSKYHRFICSPLSETFEANWHNRMSKWTKWFRQLLCERLDTLAFIQTIVLRLA